jgi:hypothetical protein
MDPDLVGGCGQPGDEAHDEQQPRRIGQCRSIAVSQRCQQRPARDQQHRAERGGQGARPEHGQRALRARRRPYHASAHRRRPEPPREHGQRPGWCLQPGSHNRASTKTPSRWRGATRYGIRHRSGRPRGGVPLPPSAPQRQWDVIACRRADHLACRPSGRSTSVPTRTRRSPEPGCGATRSEQHRRRSSRGTPRAPAYGHRGPDPGHRISQHQRLARAAPAPAGRASSATRPASLAAATATGPARSCGVRWRAVTRRTSCVWAKPVSGHATAASHAAAVGCCRHDSRVGAGSGFCSVFDGIPGRHIHLPVGLAIRPGPGRMGAGGQRLSSLRAGPVTPTRCPRCTTTTGRRAR